MKSTVFLVPFLAAFFTHSSAEAGQGGCPVDWGSTKHDGFDQGIWAKYEQAACNVAIGKRLKAASCYRSKAEQQALRNKCGDGPKCNGLVAKAGRSFHQGEEREARVRGVHAVACDFEKSGISPSHAKQAFADIGDVGTRCYGQKDVVHIDNHGPYQDKNGCN